MCDSERKRMVRAHESPFGMVGPCGPFSRRRHPPCADGGTEGLSRPRPRAHQGGEVRAGSAVFPVCTGAGREEFRCRQPGGGAAAQRSGRNLCDAERLRRRRAAVPALARDPGAGADALSGRHRPDVEQPRLAVRGDRAPQRGAQALRARARRPAARARGGQPERQDGAPAPGQASRGETSATPRRRRASGDRGCRAALSRAPDLDPPGRGGGARVAPPRAGIPGALERTRVGGHARRLGPRARRLVPRPGRAAERSRGARALRLVQRARRLVRGASRRSAASAERRRGEAPGDRAAAGARARVPDPPHLGPQPR